MKAFQTDFNALLKRTSQSRLREPIPSDQEFSLIMQSAVRAPDHANLKPWRFMRFVKEDREKLGRLFVEAVRQKGEVDEISRKKFLQMPLRAPCVLVAYSHCVEHPKVPEVEQIVATGAAITNVLHACHQLGYGAIWRTGSLAYLRSLHRLLGLTEVDHIVGFVYLGSIDQTENKQVAQNKIAESQNWQNFCRDFDSSRRMTDSKL